MLFIHSLIRDGLLSICGSWIHHSGIQFPTWQGEDAKGMSGEGMGGGDKFEGWDLIKI